MYVHQQKYRKNKINALKCLLCLGWWRKQCASFENDNRILFSFRICYLSSISSTTFILINFFVALRFPFFQHHSTKQKLNKFVVLDSVVFKPNYRKAIINKKNSYLCLHIRISKQRILLRTEGRENEAKDF